MTDPLQSISPIEPAIFDRWDPRLRLAARISAALVVAVALLVFAGWTFNIEILKSLLHRDGVPMNPVTALCFLLLAISLWLQIDPRKRDGDRRYLISWLGAALVVVIAGWRIGAYLQGWNLGIDQLLFRSRLHGNVMAPNTAAALLLLALALLVLDWNIPIANQRVHLAPGMILLAMLVALFSITGYLYSDLAFTGVRGFIPMALNTALTFAVLCVGILCARPQRQPVIVPASDTLGGVVARRLIPAAFIAPLLLGWLRLVLQRRGYLDAQSGIALLVLSNIVVFNLLIWWCATVLHKAHLRNRGIETALRQSEERYRAIMQQSAEGIYLVDLETRQILDSNSALDHLLGYSEGEARTRPVHELIDDTPENVAVRLQRVISAAGPLRGERVYRRKDGSIIDTDSSASLIEYSGRKVACTVIRDITDRKIAERALQEKHEQLQHALEQLKLAQSTLVQTEKLASLGQMVAGVAHEINNPLAFVSNNVAVLDRDGTALVRLLQLYMECDPVLAEHQCSQLEQIRELAERIDLNYTMGNMKELTVRSREGLRRIQQIVKDLRDFARIDQSDLHNDVDFNTGIESTINIISGLAKKKHVTIEKELTPLPRITAQPAKVNQVVMNLLSNAIDACNENGKVTIRSFAADNTINIQVSDTGHGIDPAVRERIFDPFFTTKPPGAGTGLGLSISYGIIRDHGGKIEVDSTPGKGSTFTIKLPVRQS